MLNERERGVLAEIERHLTGSDPHLVRRFQKLAHVRPRRAAGAAAVRMRRAGANRTMRDAGLVPCVLLACGLLMIIVGAVSAAMPVVGTGLVLTTIAFVFPVMTAGTRRPGPATA